MESKQINIEEERKAIRIDPYSYICNWMEGRLIHIGKKVFSVLSLVPCSLLLPPLPFGSSTIRSTINMLLISPPGSGKSTICSKFNMISYNPLKRRDISSADLIVLASQMKTMSLVIEDFSQIAEDYDTIKVLEGILGEEQSVSKSNMRMEILADVKAVGLICGTPLDLARYARSIESGLLSRCMVIKVNYTGKEHSEIGDYINKNIGSSEHSEKMKVIEDVIIEYYNELQNIQEGTHEKIKPITGYDINPVFKSKIGDAWKKITTNLIKDIGDRSWIRDLHEFYRLLIASAFLNIHNRDHKNGILVPNEEDFNLALSLMANNMKYKWEILKSVYRRRSRY